jgi:hypothetical protein
MNDLKIDQPRPVSFLVIDHVGHTSVAVRPGAAELVAPKLMCAPKFAPGGFHHLACERAAPEMFPKALAWQLIDQYGVVARPRGAELIAVKHPETLHLPALPGFRFRPKTDRQAGDAKIQVGQLGQLLTVRVAPLENHIPSAPAFL